MALIKCGGGGATNGLADKINTYTGNNVSNVDFDKVAIINVICTGSYSSQYGKLVYDINKNFVYGEVNGTKYTSYSGDIAVGIVVDMANGTIRASGAYPQGVGSFKLEYYN